VAGVDWPGVLIAVAGRVCGRCDVVFDGENSVRESGMSSRASARWGR
jgi:hypothetical protein